MQSETIGALAAALAKAQSQISGAVKDAANPFFKSKYADLESVWQACRKPLTDNNLAVTQTSRYTTDGLMLVTTLLHSSGEWISGEMPVVTKDASPQAQGSGITYARRYALAAIVGVYQTDDDAEAAQARGVKPDPKVLDQIAACDSAEALTALFKSLPMDARQLHMDAFTNRKKELT